MSIERDEQIRREGLHPYLSLEITLTDGSTASVHELRERFFESKYGRAMRVQRPRFYENFGYDSYEMREDLGDDICPVGHQYELPKYLAVILEEETVNDMLPISEEMLAILTFTMTIHDIGESEHHDLKKNGLTPVGDIPSGKKTAEDRRNETAIRHFFYAQLFQDVPEEIIARVEAIIAHQDTTVMHDLYEAAHELQCIDTSYRAEVALQRAKDHEKISADNDPIRFLALQAMTNEVRENSRRKLFKSLAKIDAVYQTSISNKLAA